MTPHFDQGRLDESAQPSARVRRPAATPRLNYGDFLEVARLLGSIDLRRLPAGFDFRRFLGQLLAARSRPAAALVEGSSAEELARLLAELTEYQAIAR